MDRAEMWGASFEGGLSSAASSSKDGAMADGGRVIGWSDKGTVHVWGDIEGDMKSKELAGGA